MTLPANLAPTITHAGVDSTLAERALEDADNRSMVNQPVKTSTALPGAA